MQAPTIVQVMDANKPFFERLDPLAPVVHLNKQQLLVEGKVYRIDWLTLSLTRAEAEINELPLDEAWEEAQVAHLFLEWREQAGLSCEQLAARAGLSVRSITRIERGDQRPTLASQAKLAVALGVDVVALLPPPYIPEAQLVKPANTHLRLQYLAQLADKGVAFRFAQRVGIPAITPLLAGKSKLTDLYAERILTALPGLRDEWLLQGQGPVFSTDLN